MSAKSKAIGERIRSAREAVGLTQARVAEEMSLAGYRWLPQTVVKVEAGDRALKLDEGVELAYLLGTDAQSLVTRTIEGNSPEAHVRWAMAKGRRANRLIHGLIDQRMQLDRKLQVVREEEAGLLGAIAVASQQLEELLSEMRTMAETLEQVTKEQGQDVPDEILETAEEWLRVSRNQIRNIERWTTDGE